MVILWGLAEACSWPAATGGFRGPSYVGGGVGFLIRWAAHEKWRLTHQTMGIGAANMGIYVCLHIIFDHVCIKNCESLKMHMGGTENEGLPQWRSTSNGTIFNSEIQWWDWYNMVQYDTSRNLQCSDVTPAPPWPPYLGGPDWGDQTKVLWWAVSVSPRVSWKPSSHLPGFGPFKMVRCRTRPGTQQKICGKYLSAEFMWSGLNSAKHGKKWENMGTRLK